MGQDADKLVIVLPIPAKELSPNARPHWRKKAEKTKKARLDGGLSARDAMNRSSSKFPWPGAIINIDFYHATPRGRDRDNAVASLKAYFDGFADAGIVTNDRQFGNTPPKMFIDSKDPRVVLTLTRYEF